jgi:hypothetical protein
MQNGQSARQRLYGSARDLPAGVDGRRDASRDNPSECGPAAGTDSPELTAANLPLAPCGKLTPTFIEPTGTWSTAFGRIQGARE